MIEWDAQQCCVQVRSRWARTVPVIPKQVVNALAKRRLECCA
ncbi:hypothetical protein OH687_28840 [Burkholderia anthina]|nr:hypothetical protein OH687_28840 [Burkholderia anthina]